MSPFDRLYRLIALCYEAASEGTGWSRFAAELARALSASACAAVVSGRSGAETVLWSHGRPPNRSGLWLPDGLSRRQAQQVGEGLQTAVTPDGRFLIGQISRKNGASNQLIAAWPPNAAAFQSTAVTLVGELLPHVARSLHVHRTIRNSEGKGEVLTEIMDRLPEAIFLVDRHGYAVSLNRSAREIVEQNDGLMLINDRISAAQQGEQSALRAMIEQSGPSAPTQSASPARLANDVSTLSITRPSGRPALPIVVAPVLCRWITGMERQIVAAVIAKDPQQRGSVLTPDLATAFHLTPGEARLAGLVADGLGLQEAAGALGITRNTARTHMKRVYAKTGVHSQADLVRLLNRGSIELRLGDNHG